MILLNNLMSPHSFNSSGYSYAFEVGGSDYPGHFGYDSIHLALGVRPEISLRYW